MSHKQRLASDLGSVLRANETRQPLVPPGAVRVSAKAATRSAPEKKSYGDPGSKKRAAYTEPGKQRWCPRRSRVRLPRPSGFLLRVHIGKRVPQQRSDFFLHVDDDLR